MLQVQLWWSLRSFLVNVVETFDAFRVIGSWFNSRLFILDFFTHYLFFRIFKVLVKYNENSRTIISYLDGSTEPVCRVLFSKPVVCSSQQYSVVLALLLFWVTQLQHWTPTFASVGLGLLIGRKRLGIILIEYSGVLYPVQAESCCLLEFESWTICFILSLTNFETSVYNGSSCLSRWYCKIDVIFMGFLFFTVCKSCIVRHFYYSNRCPKCNIVVHQTQPLYNIR